MFPLLDVAVRGHVNPRPSISDCPPPPSDAGGIGRRGSDSGGAQAEEAQLPRWVLALAFGRCRGLRRRGILFRSVFVVARGTLGVPEVALVGEGEGGVSAGGEGAVLDVPGVNDFFGAGVPRD